MNYFLSEKPAKDQASLPQRVATYKIQPFLTLLAYRITLSILVIKTGIATNVLCIFMCLLQSHTLHTHFLLTTKKD